MTDVRERNLAVRGRFGEGPDSATLRERAAVSGFRCYRLRLRGPCGARDEFHLAAIAQNLRKLAKLIPGPQSMPA